MPPHPSDHAPAARRVLVAGATGYIGRHVVRELVGRGHTVVALVRPSAAVDAADLAHPPGGAARTHAAAGAVEVRRAEATDPAALARDGLRGERFDAVISCLASRTGAPDDALRVDRDANLHLQAAARAAGAPHFVLLSAICVQRPRLAFQHAKLAAEAALVRSGLPYSIVRPTAFFKSLAGQVARVQRGRPFLVLGDGERTACKPIGERDLARFVADCLDDARARNAILPVGGPGPAVTPRGQAALLAELLGRPVPLRRAPPALLDAIAAALALGGTVVPRLRDAAELARIGRYYATESMLVWDEATGRYDADATPSFGTETLRDFYARVLREGLDGQALGAHAVLERARAEPTPRTPRGARAVAPPRPPR